MNQTIKNYLNDEATKLLFTEEEIKILEKEIQAFYSNFNEGLQLAHHTALINMMRLIGNRFYKQVPDYGGNGLTIIFRNRLLDNLKLKVLNSVQAILFPKKQS